jgi:hypothetical protein
MLIRNVALKAYGTSADGEDTHAHLFRNNSIECSLRFIEGAHTSPSGFEERR